MQACALFFPPKPQQHTRMPAYTIELLYPHQGRRKIHALPWPLPSGSCAIEQHHQHATEAQRTFPSNCTWRRWEGLVLSGKCGPHLPPSPERTGGRPDPSNEAHSCTASGFRSSQALANEVNVERTNVWAAGPERRTNGTEVQQQPIATDGMWPPSPGARRRVDLEDPQTDDYSVARVVETLVIVF